MKLDNLRYFRKSAVKISFLFILGIFTCEILFPIDVGNISPPAGSLHLPRGMAPRDAVSFGIVGTCDTYNALAVCVSGGVAYVADGSSGLRCVNVSNPETPTLLGTRDTYGSAYDVAVSEGVAYVADGASLQCINISNPSAPTLLGNSSTPTGAYRVCVSGGVAYVAYDDLLCINVSNPAAPTLLGYYNTTSRVEDVFVSGTVVYVADGYSGLLSINVSNPGAPTLLDNSSIEDFVIESVCVSGTLAYVTWVEYSYYTNYGLSCYNVSNPGDIIYLGQYQSSWELTSVCVSGTIAYVTYDYYDIWSYCGLQCINISNPKSYSLLRTISIAADGDAYDICVSGVITFVANADRGLQCIEIARVGVPFLFGTCDTSDARAVYVSGAVAYVADYTSGLRCINISNPTAPTILGTYDTDYAYDICISGNVAYVADYTSGLRCINVSNPRAPALLGTYDPPTGIANALDVSGGVAYILNGTYGLQCINVSNPAAPALLGTCDTSDARAVCVSGAVAYVADYTSGLRCINVSNPRAPALLGTYDTYRAIGVCVDGGVAYIADWSSGLRCINVSNPRAPALLGTCDTPGNAMSVWVEGGMAYVADYGSSSGLRCINVSNPAAPALLGTYDTFDNASDVCVSGDVAYVADYGLGLQCFKVGYYWWELPQIKDHQTGDNAWRGIASGTYDVDFFANKVNLSYAQYKICTNTAQGGTVLKDWTIISENINASSYIANWTIDIAACQEGTNYVSVRVYDYTGAYNSTDDVFYVRKETVTPTVIDNQPDDDTWQTAPGATYDVDFADTLSNVSFAQYIIWSAAGQGGTVLKDWTNIFSGLNVSAYTADWSIDFTACQEGTNYISVRVFDHAGNEGIAIDIFYVRKDTAGPMIIINQPGNDTWRSAPGSPYDVDFADAASNLSYAQYQIRSASGQGGSILKPWTEIFTGLNVSTYTADWSVDFAACQEGTNYISVRASDHKDHQVMASDVFYVRKDTIAPISQVHILSGQTFTTIPTINVTFLDAGSLWQAYFKLDSCTPDGINTMGWIPLFAESGNTTETIVFMLNSYIWTSLSDGGHVVYFKVWDQAGNVAVGVEYSWQFVKKTEPNGDNTGGFITGIVITVIADAAVFAAVAWTLKKRRTKSRNILALSEQTPIKEG